MDCIDHEFLKECDISEEEFGLIKAMSSWAVCGTRPIQTGTAEPQSHRHSASVHEADMKQSFRTAEERTTIGQQCKLLLNIGRIKALEKHGFSAQLVRYVDAQQSLENILLLGTRQQQPPQSS